MDGASAAAAAAAATSISEWAAIKFMSALGAQDRWPANRGQRLRPPTCARSAAHSSGATLGPEIRQACWLGGETY